jgi:hypothetical protein
MAAACDNDASASGISVVSLVSDINDMNENGYEEFVDVRLQSNVSTQAKHAQRTKLRAGARKFVPMQMV